MVRDRNLRDYLRREDELKEVNEGYQQLCKIMQARRLEESNFPSDEENSMEIESERGVVHVVLGAMGV